MRALPLALLASIMAPAFAGAADASGMDKAQFQASGARRMLQNDSDGDGKLSAAEWAGIAQGRGGDGLRQRLFARVDANKDGYLDKAEIDAVLATRFGRLDTNGDGRISADERRAGAQSVDGGK